MTIKAKGGIVARWDGGDFRSNSMTIIDTAVVAYLLDGTPIEQTIEECDDIERFQIIAKAGRTFQKVIWQTNLVDRYNDGIDTVDEDTQRVNRVYATTNVAYGGIFKVKMKDGKEVARSKVPLTPDHCFIDNENLWKSMEIGLTTLDKSWYVALAKKKAREFVTRNKKEREQMAEVEEKTNELKDAPKPTARKKTTKKTEEAAPEVKPTFKEKLLQLQMAMTGAATGVKFDSAVSNINHEYADTQQYKMWLASVCSQLGLIFKLNITSEFLGEVARSDKGTPSYGVKVVGQVVIRDVDSDAYEAYDISGLGVNVQPGYCEGVAQTNALRNFILNNYLLDNKGRDGDDVAMNAGTETPKGGYVSDGEKAAMKQGIADAKAEKAQYATALFATALYEKVIEAQKAKKGFGAKMLAEHFESDGTPKLGENGKSTLLKTVAVEGLNKAEEIIAKAGE